jgi:hypothetical protein
MVVSLILKEQIGLLISFRYLSTTPHFFFNKKSRAIMAPRLNKKHAFLQHDDVSQNPKY